MIEGGYLYVRSGQDPVRSRRTLGSFEGWAAVVGGILEAAGVPGFLSNRDRLGARPTSKPPRTLSSMAAWHQLACRAHGDSRPGRTLQHHRQIRRHMPHKLARCTRGGRYLKHELEYWVRGKNRAWRKGYRVVKVSGHKADPLGGGEVRS